MTRLIRDRLAAYRIHPPGPPDNERIFSLETLEVFYGKRNYEPAWFGRNSFSDAEEMIKAVRGSGNDGLIPEHYHLRMIEDLLGRAYNIKEKENFVDPEILVDLDILLTDSFFTLAHHLSTGSVNPVTLEPEWSFFPDMDLPGILAHALEEHTVGQTLQGLAPQTRQYAALRKALVRYREMAAKDDQPPIPDGRLLKKGMRSPRVAEIRERLAFLGDLNLHTETDGTLFDGGLKQAVERFQERHGLKADGIAGPSTLGELNVPMGDRVKQLLVNLERMRWNNGGRGDRYLIVNIARFELDVVEHDHVVLSMKVVVGKPFLDTPVFTGKMTYLVLNPAWNIPVSIASKEILPKVKKDPGYLKKEHITILRGWGGKEEVIDPRTIDWSSVTARKADFRFRQEPGPLNPLGRVKFMFPNKFNVYLHDTPARNLFSQNVRTFSHGCIRIEKPLELAEYLMKGDPHWTKEDITAALKDGETEDVRLPGPVTVYLVYVTAWVDEDGSAEFRNDIYGRDADLYSAITMNPLKDTTQKFISLSYLSKRHPLNRQTGLSIPTPVPG
ncbi:MAG: L,D-transpeptidase family protein [Candidatus Sulfobium sp.]